MKPTIIHLIAAARPNLMKVAPLYHALKCEKWCRILLVHTGQHYDPEMSDVFFSDLNLPRPDFSLGVGSGTHAEQTAGVMLAYERILIEKPPAWVIVVGDVNSTMACAITAKKLLLPVAHLEAGLRSRDRTMPEEINRIITDSISDLLWTPSPDADENLLQEGIAREKIVRVGNIMIDSYKMLLDKIKAKQTTSQFGLAGKDYGVVTLHRPSNVDDRKELTKIVSSLIKISETLLLVFPVHPRTKTFLNQFGLWHTLSCSSQIILVEPMGYISFMSLIENAKVVITDSGGIQEETTYLNIPCLTLRQTTERPITVTKGTNRLVNTENAWDYIQTILEGRWVDGICPEYWDGLTAERIAKSLKERLNQ